MWNITVESARSSTLTLLWLRTDIIQVQHYFETFLFPVCINSELCFILRTGYVCSLVGHGSSIWSTSVLLHFYTLKGYLYSIQYFSFDISKYNIFNHILNHDILDFEYYEHKFWTFIEELVVFFKIL